VAGSFLAQLLVAAFSFSALALTSVGLFALLSHSAARRSSEMSVRLALGASQRHVALLLLRGGLTPVLTGVVLGRTIDTSSAPLQRRVPRPQLD
jgi:putative ABC transport system permease protein